MRPLKGRLIAVLVVLGVLGLFQTSLAANDRAKPVKCSQAAEDRIATLSGTVTDVSGTEISGALVTASCGAFRQAITTDSIGAYSLQLSPGSYHVRVTADKYNPTEREVVLTTTDPVVEWKVTLAIATVKTRVLVTAPAYTVTHTTAGSKMDSSLLDVPQAITVVDHEVMKEEGAYKLDDALKNVAGVNPGGYYEAWDYYRIRGFDASFNTYIDGLRGGNGMAEEIFGLESVEVLKGPSSTLYGQSVLGGIVNLRSKVPRPDAFALVQFQPLDH